MAGGNPSEGLVASTEGPVDPTWHVPSLCPQDGEHGKSAPDLHGHTGPQSQGIAAFSSREGAGSTSLEHKPSLLERVPKLATPGPHVSGCQLSTAISFEEFLPDASTSQVLRETRVMKVMLTWNPRSHLQSPLPSVTEDTLGQGRATTDKEAWEGWGTWTWCQTSVLAQDFHSF